MGHDFINWGEMLSGGYKQRASGVWGHSLYFPQMITGVWWKDLEFNPAFPPDPTVAPQVMWPWFLSSETVDNNWAFPGLIP